jgi:GrpB-like predicted nucleotidyltransferase (UPF0157 family)
LDLNGFASQQILQTGFIVPPPLGVNLEPHDPAWALAAAWEATTLGAALGSVLVAVHHIGSTSIPGIAAKPILDLLPVVSSLDRLDACRPQLEHLGYEWWGAYGLVGRRYCTKSELVSGRRLIQLHCWAATSREIDRHLAVRDYLRNDRQLADAYETEKRRCQALHPDNSHVYADCKAAWICAVQARALAAYHLREAGDL